MKGRRIAKFFIKQSSKLVILLLAVTILSFIFVRFSPVDPIQMYIGADMMTVSPEQRFAIEKYWGLHQSGIDQFKSWFYSLLQGDFGTSLIYRKAVLSVIGERFFASFALMGLSWLLSGIIGFFLGVLAGLYKESILDKVIKGYCFILASTPAFWIGIILMTVFSVWLNLFPIGLGVPIGGFAEDVSMVDRLHHLVLPVITLSVIGIANIALHTRQKLIDIYESEFIKFARIKGEHGIHLFFRHGFKNILLPAVSIHFASFGELFGGAVLAEQVFSYPGLGQAVVQAGLQSDVPLLLGIVIFSTIFVFIGNMVADLFYRLVDPRTREDF